MGYKDTHDSILEKLSTEYVSPIGSIRSDPTADDRALLDRVRELLDRIPPLEADVVELTLKGLTQMQMAAILGLSQPSISYHLHRAIERLRWLLSMPRIDLRQMRTDMAAAGLPEATVDACVAYLETGGQTAAARRLGASQGRVRYRLLTGIEMMRSRPELADYVTVLDEMLHRPRLVLDTTRALGRREGCVID